MALGLEQASVLEPDSFLFVVGDSEYSCSRFQALFLSKTVSSLFLTDPVLQHGTFEVTEANLYTLRQFTQRLKCEELDRRLFEFELSGEDLNERNAVAHLLLKPNRLLSIDEEVEFIAFRLDEIESLDRLPPSLLEIVLECVSLRIETEDWLLELICGLGSEYES
jgi:hypothetical protein